MYESQLATKVDNNFSRTLPMEQAQYANEVFSSSYNLGFLGVTSPILELELEDRLVKAITRFLMELGNGFTFIVHHRGPPLSKTGNNISISTLQILLKVVTFAQASK